MASVPAGMGYGAFQGSHPANRIGEWWYTKSRAARVNKLLFAAAGISLIAFVSTANRDLRAPSTGLATATAPPAAVTVAEPTSTVLRTAARPETAAPVPPGMVSTTSSGPGPVITGRAATPTTATPRTPTTAGDPGVIFSDPPPSPTTASTASTAPAPTTTAAPTTTSPPPSTTAATAPPLLQLPVRLPLGLGV